MCLKATFLRRCKYSFQVHTSSAVVLLTSTHLRSLLPHPAGSNARRYLCSCWTWSQSSSRVAAEHILNAHIMAFSPCDRIQSNRMLRVLPGSPSQPSPKDSETLFCSPGIRANCLVTGDPGAYLLSWAGLSPPGRAP